MTYEDCKHVFLCPTTFYMIVFIYLF